VEFPFEAGATDAEKEKATVGQRGGSFFLHVFASATWLCTGGWVKVLPEQIIAAFIAKSQPPKNEPSRKPREKE